MRLRLFFPTEMAITAGILPDFSGFRVSDENIEPLSKYLDAIRDFPTPSSTTNRSWFGLVN